MNKTEIQKVLKLNGYAQSQKHYTGIILNEYPATIEIGYYHFRTATILREIQTIRNILEAAGIAVERDESNRLVIAKDN